MNPMSRMKMMEILKLEVGDGIEAFSTMRGNVSQLDASNPYSDFNVCHYTGDDAMHISHCRSELAKLTEVAVDRLLIPRQTHSVNVVIIGKEIPDLEGVDGMVTCRDDVALVVNTADCLPIVFNDSKHGIVGVAHGGWRGLYGGIIEETIAAMTVLGAELQEIRVAIGPCICGDCYEVDAEFARKFEARMGDCVIELGEREKPHVDLRRAAVDCLGRIGIAKSNINVVEECSRCDERFFSARRMGVESGRIATVVKKVGKVRI